MIVGIGIVILTAAGAVYYATTQTAEAPEMVEKEGEAMMEKEERGMTAGYEGTRLAGDSAPLLDFTKADFDEALKSDKLMVLYFFANWCPICRVEFPKAQAAFDELTSDQVLGFRVNFNDNQTDADEVALARQHGIAYQHTKVFIRNGKQILKSPESWEQSRYMEEITNALAR